VFNHLLVPSEIHGTSDFFVSVDKGIASIDVSRIINDGYQAIVNLTSAVDFALELF